MCTFSTELTDLVPELDVESEVDVKVLVVVVVEHGVRLPRLPPLPLERDARVVEDAVVVRVDQDRRERHWKKKKEGRSFIHSYILCSHRPLNGVSVVCP